VEFDNLALVFLGHVQPVNVTFMLDAYVLPMQQALF